MKTPFKLGLACLFLCVLPAHAAITVTNLAQGCSPGHSLFLQSDGSLWAMGYNNEGQLGDGTTFNAKRPEQIMASNVTVIAVGAFHSLILKSDGSLWAMGYNAQGELGDGTTNNANKPEKIVTNGVTAIAGGVYHSLFLKSDGSLWAMGSNLYGQLGDGTYNATNLPEEIVTNDVTAIAAGQWHSLFLKSDGSLWAMGYNYDGELGDGTNNNTNRPEKIVSSGVTNIATGIYHSLFRKSDGSLWGMGDNFYGELGDGTFNSTNKPEQIVSSGVTAMSAGAHHNLFLKSGSLWAMGWNLYGQLGDGTYATNSPHNGTNKVERILSSGVTAISAAGQHSLFLKSDGSLWAVGNNHVAELGDGFIDTNSPAYGTPMLEQIVPTPQLDLTQTISAGTNLQFTATCPFGGNFYLLAVTNLALPVSQWTSVRTNFITARGTNNYSITLTNVLKTKSQQFYILQSH